MKPNTCLFLFFVIFTFPFANCSQAQQTQDVAQKKNDTYQCTPCGYDCDNVVYNEPGECPHCHMQLVKKSTVNFKTIEPSAICQYISQHPDVVLLDVRTKEEFEGKATPNFGTLKNAINIPVQELENRISEIERFKNKEVIVYCSHSHRSPRASYMLTQHGFTNVSNMAGGMSVVSDTTCRK